MESNDHRLQCDILKIGHYGVTCSITIKFGGFSYFWTTRNAYIHDTYDYQLIAYRLALPPSIGLRVLLFPMNEYLGYMPRSREGLLDVKRSALGALFKENK